MRGVARLVSAGGQGTDLYSAGGLARLVTFPPILLSLLGGKIISIAINPVFADSYAAVELGRRPALLVAESCDGRHEENSEEQTTSWLLDVGDADRCSDVHNHYSDCGTAVCQDYCLFA